MVREQNFLIKVLRKTKQNVKYNVKISTQSHVLEYDILSKNKKSFISICKAHMVSALFRRHVFIKLLRKMTTPNVHLIPFMLYNSMLSHITK